MLEKAFCPKCRSALLYVTALPHPTAPQMRKTTFVCRPCNRTWTYPLTVEIAELYAAESSFELSALTGRLSWRPFSFWRCTGFWPVLILGVWSRRCRENWSVQMRVHTVIENLYAQ
jgi:hypothetical protein